MPDSITPEAAIIVLNRLKSENRIDIDRDRLRAAADLAITAINRCLVKREPVANEEGGAECPFCGESVDYYIFTDKDKYCSSCGQALDWGGET